MSGCGGCEGIGSHRRWCPAVCGYRASVLGQASDSLGDLGDRLSAIDLALANDVWALGSRLGVRAVGADIRNQEGAR